MKLSLPVGCIVSISEELSWGINLYRVLEIFSRKLIQAKWDSIAITDIDDEGVIHIIEISNNGYKKIKYEDWAKDKFIEIHELSFTHSKEELYKLLAEQAPKYSKFKRFRISAWDFLYHTSILIGAFFSSYTLILNKNKVVAFTSPTPAQYAAGIWNTLTKKLPLWHEHIPESLNSFLNDNGTLLYRGEAKDLVPSM